MDYCTVLSCVNQVPCILHPSLTTSKSEETKVEGECQICCCDGEAAPLICAHLTCTNCMKQYAAAQLEQGNTKIKCPSEGCDAVLSSELLFEYLGSDPRFTEFFGGDNEVCVGTLRLDGRERKISAPATFTPPGFLQPLPEFFSDLLGPGYFRLGVFADGSCFYHALFELLNEKYRNIDGEDRKTKREMGWAERKAFAQTLSKEDVVQSGVFVHLQDDPNRKDVHPESVLSRVSDFNKWAENEDFLLVQYKLKVNLWILEIGGHSDINVEVPPSGISITKSVAESYAPESVKDQPNLLLLYLTNLHFEPIVFVDEAKGVMKLVCDDDKVVSRLKAAFASEYAKHLLRQKAFLRT